MPGKEDATRAEAPRAVAAVAERRRPSKESQRDSAVHDHPTAPPMGSGAASRSLATSPAEALREDEIQRTRSFLRLALGLVGAALLAIGIADGDPVAKAVVVAGCAAIGAASAWMLWATRDPEGYTTRRIVVVAVAGAVGASSALFYWGVASPATAVVLFGIYFFSLGTQPVVTVVLYGLCASAHLVLSLLIMSGALRERGVVALDALALRDQIATTLVVQALFAVAFATGRASRRATLAAVSRLERAVRGVAQREAALVEARADLDRALKVGGPGRFSEQVVGSYRLGVLLGRGGMGEVYAASHVETGAAAAVKLLHSANLGEAHHVERFLREADVAARLVSPYIVTVLEIGTTTGELPFIAMERLVGEDLAAKLRRHRTMSPSSVVEMVTQVARGLAVARAAGVVHRDLKPHNLFCAEREDGPRWTILDFGVATTTSASGTLTGGQVVGTPAYMSPEQGRGEPVDHRSDVYALAAIAYRALCGQPPHGGADLPAVLHELAHVVPRRPSELATLPVDVDRALALGLAKDPAQRAATSIVFAELFAAACAGQLQPRERARADAVTARWPWGRRVG